MHFSRTLVFLVAFPFLFWLIDWSYNGAGNDFTGLGFIGLTLVNFGLLVYAIITDWQDLQEQRAEKRRREEEE